MYEFVAPHVPAQIIGHEELRFFDCGSQAFYRRSFAGEDARITKAAVPRKHLN